MKKTGILITALLLAVLTTAAWKDRNPIRIGFSGDITGENSALAVSGLNAVQMAVEEVNREGGLLRRPVELVIRDDRGLPAVAAQVDEEFVRTGVPVVIGHFMSNVALASANAIINRNILMVSPTISTSELSGLDDNFMRVSCTNRDQGQALSAYARDMAGDRRSIILYSSGDQPYADGVAESFRESFQTRGGQVVFEAMISERDTLAMERALNEAVLRNADSVLLILDSSDVAVVAQLIAKRNLPVHIYSATWGMTEDVIRQGGQSAEGIVFPALFDPNSKADKYGVFKAAYAAACGQEPDFVAVQAYEAAQLVFEGIRMAGEADSERIKASILERGTFQGVQSEFTITATGDTIRPRFIVAVRDGAFVTVGHAE